MAGHGVSLDEAKLKLVQPPWLAEDFSRYSDIAKIMHYAGQLELLFDRQFVRFVRFWTKTTPLIPPKILDLPACVCWHAYRLVVDGRSALWRAVAGSGIWAC